MGDVQILLAALFVSAAGLNALANRLALPYPIPLVIGGLVLGLIPGIPNVTLNPDLVLLVFLPPLLYSSLVLRGPAQLSARTPASSSSTRSG